jgi:alkylated DNA repair dioxygenase AlkB
MVTALTAAGEHRLIRCLVARGGPHGAPVLLMDQDRTRWDQLLIRRGLAVIDRIDQRHGPAGPYALQAEIAACHVRARTAADTDWPRIAAVYGGLARINPSPVVERCRRRRSSIRARARLDVVLPLFDVPAMRQYHLLPAVAGDLTCRAGHHENARHYFLRAVALTPTARNEPRGSTGRRNSRLATPNPRSRADIERPFGIIVRVVTADESVPCPSAVSDPSLIWQPSLFDGPNAAEIDVGLSSLARHHLDAVSWVDYAPGWVRGADAVFARLAELRPWGQRTRRMFDREVVEPRLTSSWSAAGDRLLEPAVVEQMRAVLSAHYGVSFDSAGFNLYRDGRDSVAWHGDRIAREIAEPVVALVSLGDARPFLLRPRGGGPSRRFVLGGGDLLVTGGRTQRDWQHSVPKVAAAGPRISIAFRHGRDGPGSPATQPRARGTTHPGVGPRR